MKKMKMDDMIEFVIGIFVLFFCLLVIPAGIVGMILLIIGDLYGS